MKYINKNKLFFIAVFCMFITGIGCKKEAGVGGKKIVSGIVYFKNGVTGNNDIAASARVFISYGTSDPSAAADLIIVTGLDGNYKIQGLNKGNYFIKADFTDGAGFKYSHPGFAVNIKNKKGELKLDMILD